MEMKPKVGNRSDPEPSFHLFVDGIPEVTASLPDIYKYLRVARASANLSWECIDLPASHRAELESTGKTTYVQDHPLFGPVNYSLELKKVAPGAHPDWFSYVITGLFRRTKGTVHLPDVASFLRLAHGIHLTPPQTEELTRDHCLNLYNYPLEGGADLTITLTPY